MQLFDSHAHIHDSAYEFVPSVYEDSVDVGVTHIMCVGTTVKSSKEAIDYANAHVNTWASIGLHPHEAGISVHDTEALTEFTSLVNENKVVAIGECGLDYFYNHSLIDDQQALLRMQLQLAQDNNVPLIFHVREAFEDFWPIFDEYKGLRGVLHSFTDSEENMREAVKRGLYIGLNGIMTFTKNPDQLAMAKAVPLENLLLETDAPYLTPTPKRGKMNEPKYLELTAKFLSELRNESLDTLARNTFNNAKTLFGINN